MEDIIVPPIFKDYDVIAIFTTKALGLKNILIKYPFDRIYIPLQKHTDKIVVLDFDRSERIGDGVVTKERGIMIGVQVADCVPILLFDRRRDVVAAVHAGWRGTASGILKKMIELMERRYHSFKDDIILSIGPSIRWCCYEVGYDVLEAVKKETGNGDYFLEKGQKYCLDLPTANKYQALGAGIKEKNIWLSNECTYCLPEKYYSYRFSKGITGRQYGLIGMV
jgi:YfiH family protein